MFSPTRTGGRYLIPDCTYTCMPKGGWVVAIASCCKLAGLGPACCYLLDNVLCNDCMGVDAMAGPTLLI